MSTCEHGWFHCSPEDCSCGPCPQCKRGDHKADHALIQELEAELRQRHGRRAAEVVAKLQPEYVAHLLVWHAETYKSHAELADEPLRHLRDRHAVLHEECDCA